VKRRSALARLAAADARHVLRRRLSPSSRATAEDVLRTYAADRLQPLTAGERSRLPVMSRCINCGLCAMVVGRVGRVRLPDLGSSYLRDLTLLPSAARDLDGGDPGASALAAAAAVCPVGVPVDELAAIVHRLASNEGGRA
jgi:hypothetical protein